jgi:protoporphyrinogen oxidase
MDYPFLAVVEHTNFMDKKKYANKNILYVGNYLPHEHKYFKMNEKDLINEFMPYLKKINASFKKKDIEDAYLFKAYFAQPVITLNYSNMLPDIKTPINNLYLANIQQVYPWDRGTNYAVELGQKAAEMAISKYE